MRDFDERKDFLFFFSKFRKNNEKIVERFSFIIFSLKKQKDFLSYLLFLFGGWPFKPFQDKSYWRSKQIKHFNRGRFTCSSLLASGSFPSSA